MAELLKDKLRPASFRGVPFQVQSAELSTGRRTQLHEYPQRDKPYAQDMGRATRGIQISAFVIGVDYIAKAGALLTALETSGPGELIHPWLGTMRVSVIDSASVAFDEKLGYAEFSLSFIEAGELTYPSAATNTAQATRTAASNLQSKAAAFFGAVVRVVGFANRVATQALKVYGMVRNIIANPLGFAFSALGYSSLPGNIVSLSAIFGAPLDLGKNYGALLSVAGIAKNIVATAQTPAQNDRVLLPIINGLVDAQSHPALADVLGLTSPAAPASANPSIPYGTVDAYQEPAVQAQYLSKFDAYAQATSLSLALGGSIDIPPLSTSATLSPARRQEFANLAAINAQTRQLLLVQACGLSSLLQCAVYDEIIALRDKLCAALDREALSISAAASLLDVAQSAAVLARLTASAADPAAAQDLYVATIELRAAVYQDLTARAQDAARLVTIQKPITLPALVIAYDLYEDAARETEIVERNKGKHPGFIAPNPLKVLSR